MFTRVGLFEFADVLELPFHRGHVLEGGKWQQLPVGFARFQAEKEIPLIPRQAYRQLPEQPVSCFFQHLKADVVSRHANEIIAIGGLKRLRVWRQDFVDGAIVAADISDERLAYFSGQPLILPAAGNRTNRADAGGPSRRPACRHRVPRVPGSAV